jgi:hypothetical protein
VFTWSLHVDRLLLVMVIAWWVYTKHMPLLALSYRSPGVMKTDGVVRGTVLWQTVNLHR